MCSKVHDMDHVQYSPSRPTQDFILWPGIPPNPGKQTKKLQQANVRHGSQDLAGN